MLASVLNTPIAVQASVQVVRAFVRLQEVLGAHKDLARKLAELERRIGGYDESIRILFDAIRQLMAPWDKPRRSISFRVEEARLGYRRRRLRRAPSR